MKKLLSFVIIAVLTAAMAFAVPGNGVGSPDNECSEHGFDFGIAKFECDDDEWNLSEEGVRNGYSATADGEDCTSVDWTSSPAADGVLEKAGQDYFTHAGGTEGTVYQSGQHEISHITLCGNDDENEVPEFTVIAAGTVLALGGLFAVSRRKKN